MHGVELPMTGEVYHIVENRSRNMVLVRSVLDCGERHVEKSRIQ
jgi:hypothetical protein